MSIQGLILIPDPIYNEPGYERMKETTQGRVSYLFTVPSELPLEIPHTCITGMSLGTRVCPLHVCVLGHGSLNSFSHDFSFFLLATCSPEVPITMPTFK